MLERLTQRNKDKLAKKEGTDQVACSNRHCCKDIYRKPHTS